MRADLSWLWSRLNANYWFWPALFSVLAVAFALAMVWLDRHGFSEALNDTQWIVPARPNSASNMLTVIAGSMIGVASTVFSITIAAVAYASGTYGPRLLTNFMEDKGNQLSLATFIGTFVYALTVLRTVRAEDEVASNAADAASTTLPGFVPQLSLLIAYGLMAVSVAVLVFFLNHVPSSIRINTVLEGIGRRLLKGIRSSFPDENTGLKAPEAPKGGQQVRATRIGYVQIIDFEGLCDAAQGHSARIALEVRTGDFVHRGSTLARMVPDDGSGDEEAQPYLEGCFSFGATRTPKQDSQFLIDELVEIGLRALSPGINDPFTAITAMHWLGAATAELGARELIKLDRDQDGKGDAADRVIPLPDDFDHYLQRGFGAMRSAVATSHTAALVMFDTLRHAAAPIEDERRRRLLAQQGDLLIEQVRLNLQGPDLQDVEARYVGFSRAFA
ncbi:DUF2254 domain-containing protein [Tsuneonella sp. HG222]